jgi:hypothetical protein
MLMAVLVIAIGMMGCEADPMSSNDSVREYSDNESQTYAIQTDNPIPDEATTMGAPARTEAAGFLKYEPKGGCWFLIEKPGVIGFELQLLGEYLTPNDEGRNVRVWGIELFESLPVCNPYFTIFKVEKIEYKQEEEE